MTIAEKKAAETNVEAKKRAAKAKLEAEKTKAAEAQALGKELVLLCYGAKPVDEAAFGNALESFLQAVSTSQWPPKARNSYRKGVEKARVAKLLVVRNDGVWGAYDQKTALCGLLRPALWEAKRDAASTLKMVKRLLAAGSNIHARQESYNWKGSGYSTSAGSYALGLGKRAENFISAEERLEVMRMMLSNGACINTPERFARHSMRTDGYTNTTYFLESLSCPKHATQLVPFADFGINKQRYAQNERGYDADDDHSAIYIACQHFLGSHTSECASYITLLRHILKESHAKTIDVDSYNKSLRLDRNPDWEEGMDDNPRASGYVSPVVAHVVIETSLHLCIRSFDDSAQAPLALYLLRVLGGASIDCPRVDTPRKGFVKRDFEFADKSRYLGADERMPGTFYISDELHTYPASIQKILLERMLPDTYFAYLPETWRRRLMDLALCCLRKKLPRLVSAYLLQELLHSIVIG